MKQKKFSPSEFSDGRTYFDRFAGLRGKSLFHRPFLSIIEKWRDNIEIPKFLERIKKTGDDRSLAILTNAALEDEFDKILKTLMPRYNVFDEDMSFVLSLKIKVLESFALIPKRITDGAHIVRKIRNKFAHKFHIESFSDIDEKLMKKASKYYDEVNEPYKLFASDKTEREIFYRIAQETILGLRAYRLNIGMLRTLMDEPETVDKLENYYKEGNKYLVDIIPKIKENPDAIKILESIEDSEVKAFLLKVAKAIHQKI